ncbi:MAG: PmoA family protein [Candidatus Hydrogenedentes bacterium]|nr:PmoA family protein [Candidatus Hydrogenedentota bacterium]
MVANARGGVLWLAILAPAILIPSAASSPLTVEAVPASQEIRINIAGKHFTSYKFAETQKYPYLYPVAAPASGASVTTESSEPYPHHHSLFFGCDKVNGNNYWQDENEQGQILSQGPKIIEASGNRVVIEDTCLWQRAGAEPDIRDTRTIVVAAPSDSVRRIDFEITLEPLKDVRIEKTNHSLFAARVVPELSVTNGGRLVNAEGKEKEAGTYGVPSPWCSYSSERDGVREGIAIFQHSTNRWYPSQWFTRDYGFFSPTPMYWLPDGHLDLPKGERLTLRYRVVVYSGDVDIGALFAEYADNPPNTNQSTVRQRAGSGSAVLGLTRTSISRGPIR